MIFHPKKIYIKPGMKLKMKINWTFILIIFCACSSEQIIQPKTLEGSGILVAGIAQDAGFPQADCNKACCKSAWLNTQERELVSCLAIVDQGSKRYWLIDATPDIKDQMQLVKEQFEDPEMSLAGVLITHAHIGHYTGLMHLGREVIGAKEVPVYAMPKMKDFLENNGPWSQLVNLKNIVIQPIQTDTVYRLNDQFSFSSFKVPHRDEFSETVGFRIKGKNKSVLFIPDIDKWQKWDRSIVNEVGRVDYAFLDGTFFENGEIPGRDMSEIPHPFIMESMETFSDLPIMEKEKIHFIHLNHTNPALQHNSEARRKIKANNFNLAQMGQWVRM